MGVGVGAHLAGDLQADLGDQRPGDRRAQQVHPFVFRLPLEHGEGKIAAKLLLGVDDAGGAGADVAGLFQNRLAIFARLPQIDVDGVNVVALFHEPAENDRGVQSARISQNASRHESLFVARKTELIRSLPKMTVRTPHFEPWRGEWQGETLGIIARDAELGHYPVQGENLK